jgi:hypothetical protein
VIYICCGYKHVTRNYLKMNDQEYILETLERIKNSQLKKDSHFYPEFGGIKIWDAVQQWKEDYRKDEFKPAIVILRVVLAANRKYNTVVRPNIDRIIKEHPEIDSFESLKSLIDSKTREEFYSFWGHKNLKKYNVLLNILDATDQLREKYKIVDDFKLMQEWAKDVELDNYENDTIGRIKNVAIATIQHLRMDFGINTVKPDQRVIEVLEREFGYKKVSQTKAIRLVEGLAKLTQISARKLDLIMVNYGSGYYDNRKYHSNLILREEIANKLMERKVDLKIIYESTGIKIKCE